MARYLVLLLAVLALGSRLDAADDVPSIGPIIEVRDGHAGVFGMHAVLGWAFLKDAAALRLIRVTERKHGHDLTDWFEISATAGLGTIVCRRHDGRGNFGSENILRLTIPRAAFAEPFNRGGDLELDVASDPPAAAK